MNAQNPNQEIDSLKVTENEDGTFLVEWDAKDPKYSMFNHLTEGELNDMLNEAIKSYLETLETHES